MRNDKPTGFIDAAEDMLRDADAVEGRVAFDSVADIPSMTHAPDWLDDETLVWINARAAREGKPLLTRK